MGALGLDRQRQTNRKRLFERIVERVDLTIFSGSDFVRVLKEYAVLCDPEEGRQNSSLSTQEEPEPVSGQEDKLPANDGAPLAEATPLPVPEGDAASAAVDNEQGEQGVAPVANLKIQNLEPAVTNTVQ